MLGAELDSGALAFRSYFDIRKDVRMACTARSYVAGLKGALAVLIVDKLYPVVLFEVAA